MLVSLLVAVVVVLLIGYVISLIPMDARARQIVYVVFAVVVLIYLLHLLGVGV